MILSGRQIDFLAALAGLECRVERRASGWLTIVSPVGDGPSLRSTEYVPLQRIVSGALIDRDDRLTNRGFGIAEQYAAWDAATNEIGRLFRATHGTPAARIATQYAYQELLSVLEPILTVE